MNPSFNGSILLSHSMVVLCIIIGIAMGAHIAIHKEITVFTFRFNSICLIMIFKVENVKKLKIR